MKEDIKKEMSAEEFMAFLARDDNHISSEKWKEYIKNSEEVEKGNFRKIVAKINPYSNNSSICLDDGTQISGVQSITFTAKVGEVTKVKIEAIMTEAQLTALQRDTEIVVRVIKD